MKLSAGASQQKPSISILIKLPFYWKPPSINLEFQNKNDVSSH
jgi:hypothetical protein